MKKKRKLTKKQIRLKKEKDAKIKALKEKLFINMNKFSKKHKVYQICYPSGMKVKNGVCASQSFWQQIYVCKTKCNKQCDDFLFKTYLCRDIGCTYYPVCMSKSESKRIKYCKSKNLHKERKHLHSLYMKYFHLMAIYRGLKLDADRTLRYLKQRAEKKKALEAKCGKISDKVHRKKGKKTRSSKTSKNKGLHVSKAPSKSNTKRSKSKKRRS